MNGILRRRECHYVFYYSAVRNRGPLASFMMGGYNWKDNVKMIRDRDVITQANRRVDEMQHSVAANRALIERTRVLIERIRRLLSSGGRQSYPAQE